jgi:hypothetical protein
MLTIGQLYGSCSFSSFLRPEFWSNDWVNAFHQKVVYAKKILSAQDVSVLAAFGYVKKGRLPGQF